MELDEMNTTKGEPLNFIHVSDDGDVVICSAIDLIAAQALIEKELGREVPRSEINYL